MLKEQGESMSYERQDGNAAASNAMQQQQQAKEASKEDGRNK